MPDPFAPSQSAFAPNANAWEPDRGIVGTIVHELGLDLKGGAKVVGASAGELVELLGFSVPLTYEDLSTRDVKGAMMLAAMGVGGLGGGLALKALPGAMATTWGGRAAATAISETVAGAAFGLVAPLEEDQSRLGSIVGNAALGGGIGAGASMIKSAAKATIGARIGAIRLQASRVKMGEAVTHMESEKLLREMAGIELVNKGNSSRMAIHLDGDGYTRATYYEPGKKAVSHKVSDFGSAIAAAVKEGFNAEMRPWNPQRALKGMETSIDAETMKLLGERKGDIIQAVGQAEVGRYRAVREMAELDAQFNAEMSALVGEVLAPATDLGTPMLNATTRATIMEELSIKGVKQIPFIEGAQDGELLRMAARAGLVDVHNLAHGASLNDFMSELTLNNAFSVGVSASDIVVNRQRDAVFTSILPGARIAKLFPAIAPVVAHGEVALQGIEKAMMKRHQWLFDLKARVSPESAEQGVDLIEDSIAQTMNSATGQLEDDIIASRQLAIDRARAGGNEEVATFVEQVTGLYAEYLDAMQATGVMRKGGRSGYFTIANANKWKLDVTSWGADGKQVDFQGFWSTREEALAEASRVRGLKPEATGLVSARGFAWEKGALMGLEPAQLGRMRKAMIEVLTEAFGPEEVAEMGAGGVKSAADAAIFSKFFVKAPAPKRATPFVRQRRLGIRDFAADPFTALDTYIQTTERALGLHSYEALTRPIVEALPASQGNLKAWGTQLIDDIMGKPRESELAFDAVMDHIGFDVQPRALRRYASALRKWESFSRLGGFFSGVVNLSQLAVNTYPVLGARYTARGFAALNNWQEANDTLIANGLDIGMAMPFAQAGDATQVFFGGPVAALKEKRYVEALNRTSLFVFNKAEQVNRLVTAWGAYQQALDGGATAKLAAATAQEVMERTQFNYRMTNMPEVLRGPVGGLLLQFKSFVINEIEFIASLSPAEAMRFGQAISVLGGMSLFFNMPGPDLANVASLGWSQQRISEALQRKTAEEDTAGWKVMTYGLPGLLGVNMSDQIGVGGIRDIAQGILGPAAKDAQAFYTFAKNARLDHVSSGRVSDETKNALMQSVLPTALRRLKRGMDIANTGEVRSSYTGKLVYQPAERAKVAFATAVGMPTIDMTYELTANAVVERTREGYIRARGSFGREIGMSVIEGRSDDFRQAMAEASAAGHLFSGDDVRQWTAQMRKPASQRRLQRTAKMNRQELADLFELTGSTDPL